MWPLGRILGSGVSMATHGWLEGPGLRYISIVCAGTMSSHYHAVVVDNCARLPKFLEHFHKLYTKHQNVLRGRWEAFWASEQTSVVELVKQDDVLAKMIYAITNPVTGHLVDRVYHGGQHQGKCGSPAPGTGKQPR